MGNPRMVMPTLMNVPAQSNEEQQLFHQMGRDGVPLDEVSNLMSRISHPKGRRQHVVGTVF